MINRHYQDKKVVKNDGMSTIAVIIDNSETEKTTACWRYLTMDREWPAMHYNDRDLVFYIIEGKGKIKVWDEIYNVTERNLLYVPSGSLYQVITVGGEQLSYLLFTSYNDSGKKWVPHPESQNPHPEKGHQPGARLLSNPEQGKVYEFGSNTTTLLLERNSTNDVELALIRWYEGSRGAMVAHKDKEQTFFLLSGQGEVTVGGVTQEVRPGHIIFIPRNTPHTSEAIEGELVYLCMNSLVNPADESFETMYKRVIPGRMERWKKGNDEVGE